VDSVDSAEAEATVAAMEAVTAVDLAEVVKEAGSVVDLEEAMEEDSVAVTEVATEVATEAATEVATEVDSEAAKADLAPARKTPRLSLLSYHERKKKPRALH
jgi:hypothetical protein